MGEPVLRDLQSVLRKHFNSNDLIVQKVTTSSMVPPGENYGSTILKVRAVIKKRDSGEPKELHLIAKMLPPTEFQRIVFDCDYTVRKEIYLYEELFPAYQQLEREFGVKEVFDVLPKYYGSRLTLKEKDVVDEDAVILLENLKERGFYIVDRMKGLDLEHAKVAVKAMARFHVLGIAMKYKKPDYFEILKFRAKCMTFRADEFESVMVKIKIQIQEDPELMEYRTTCQKALSVDSMDVWMASPTEPWSTIVHSDFWVNNVLFHRNQSGKVDEIKFVDFQNYLFLSPLRELAFLLAISTSVEIANNHYQELVDLYYHDFIFHLKTMKCDVSPFSREEFDRKLLEDGNTEFSHCIFMLKILTTEVDRNTDSSQVKDLMLSSGNGYYRERLRILVRSFAERGWL